VTHVDLFTGIGGFTLAARWNGINTIIMCEADERRRDFLEEQWPGIPIHPDVRTFDGTAYRGAFLLTGGVPCQPASRAGKQKGASDDRWLWLEAIRVLGEVNPTWALFENPPGIGDVGLAGIVAQMESLDYQVRVFGIPACAIGAPHRRERYWIVAHPARDAEGVLRKTTRSMRERTWAPTAGDVADADETGRNSSRPEFTQEGLSYSHCGTWGFSSSWSHSIWLPCADGKLRRAPDDSFGVVDGLHRSVLAVLGDSIVPQVAAEIIAAMIEAERTDGE